MVVFLRKTRPARALVRLTSTVASAVLVCSLVASCSAPPDPASYVIDVDARTEHWQGQPLGSAPGAGIPVQRGDVVVLSVSGEITYRSELLGLRRATSGPWSDPSRENCPGCYQPSANQGVLLWRVGDNGTVRFGMDGRVSFTAERPGNMQFMVNDVREEFEDNSGRFRVTVTVVRR